MRRAAGKTLAASARRSLEKSPVLPPGPSQKAVTPALYIWMVLVAGFEASGAGQVSPKHSAEAVNRDRSDRGAPRLQPTATGQ